MNNLLNSKAKVYRRKLTEQEIYEQDSFYFLEVEDYTGRIIEKVGGTEFIDSLFQGMQCCRLSSILNENIDNNYYKVSVVLAQRGERDIVGKVKITKRQIPLKVKELIDRILKRNLEEE